ncbi:MAG: putative Excinuclease subunit domain protein [Dehalococcoidia bacterium]|nr:putative Excinuclease subunit domain protein [Dehalococcoidia bacterium]
MADPFTIRIFVPDGDPEGVRLIDRMNWTGVGVAFPRTKWTEVRQRPEIQRTGVYILRGYVGEDADLPTLYIGQADSVLNRIESHVRNKDFWDWGIVFVSASSGLNRAHVTWLEYALVKRANEASQCHLYNGTAPQEPALTEAEKADTQGFLKEILQILPLVGLRAFEFPKPVAVPAAADAVGRPRTPSAALDTVVVPAQKEGFEQTFLGQDCWYAIRISGGMLDKIKYIAAYQTQPVSAMTHYAPVARIEPYGEEGKYKLIFSEKAKPIGPIPFGDALQGAMQGPRYTNFAKLQTAKKLTDLVGRA